MLYPHSSPQTLSTWTSDLLSAVCAECRPSEVLPALSRIIRLHDPDILAHGQRTVRYASLLGKASGLSDADLTDLGYAALLHDIGTLTIPLEIRHTHSPLAADEYALVQSHPRAGAELLEPIPFLSVASVWIAHHHERWDGTGYPYGVRGTYIPFASRILAVADTFDAMTSGRAGHRAMDGDSALRLLRLIAGSQLDPQLVERFVRLGPDIVSYESIGRTHG
ncbi:MAG: HD domain-containing protein [Nitrospirae bacterium]|nr:MAG: HD domain-containing protein [Nitrospirota bacterium]